MLNNDTDSECYQTSQHCFFALKMLEGTHSQAGSSISLQKTPAWPLALNSLPHSGYPPLIIRGHGPEQDSTRLGEELHGEATYRFFTLS